MPRRRAPPLTWVVAVVVLSAAGLVGLALVSLSATLRGLESAAREEARRAAEATASGVRRALASPAFLGVFPEAARFALAERALVVPSELGPLETAAGDDIDVDPLVAQAQRLEVAGDAAAALELLGEARASALLDGERKEQVGVAAAWCAARAGLDEARDALLGELGAGQALAVQPSLLLLAVRSGRPLPDWAEAAVRAMPLARAQALLGRLAEHGVATDALAKLRAAAEAAEAQRATLRRVMPLARGLAPRTEAVLEVREGDLLVYLPRSEGTGEGLLVAAEGALAALRAATDVASSQPGPVAGLPAFVWRGELRLAAAGTPDAVAAVPGLWIVPEPPPRPALFARPGFVAAALAGLAAVLGLSVLLMLRAASRERAALAVQREFLTSVTHELKTPLSSIRALCELMDDPRVTSDAKRRDYRRMLQGEAGRLGVLVENVLDLGRMERGEHAYDRRALDLLDVATEAAAAFGPIAERAGVHLTMRGASAPVRVRGDRAALTQALLNLIDNACKYGGAPVEVVTSVADLEARVQVLDHGPGVPASERVAIFERFRRGSAQQDGSVPGLGLGLYLARTIARAHGGDLVCRERPDGERGACFELRLPLDEPGNEAQP